MIQVSFNSRRMNTILDRVLEVFVERTANALLTNVRKHTPKRSGQAKASWRKTKQSDKKYLVSNKQPYMGRLDRGYSKQAPDGFYKPGVIDTQRTNRGRFAT